MHGGGKILDNVKEGGKVWSIFKLPGMSGEALDEVDDWYKAFACTPVLPNTGKCWIEMEI